MENFKLVTVADKARTMYCKIERSNETAQTAHILVDTRVCVC